MSSGGSCIARLDRRRRRAAARSRPGRDEPVVEPLVGADVGVLQVDQRAAWRRPSRGRRGRGTARAACSLATQSSSPAHCIGSRSSRVEHRLPAGQHVDGLLVGVGAVAVLDVLAGQVEVLHLQLDGGQPAAVAQRDQVLQRRVVRDRRAAPRPAARRARSRSMKPVLDHRQHQRGGADLEVGRDLGEVGVADDDVQAAVLLGVGVRLVAGVDDRPLERRLEADLDLEVVGALADLEAVRRGRPGRCRPGRRRMTTWRLTKNGVRCRTMSANGVERRIR